MQTEQKSSGDLLAAIRRIRKSLTFILILLVISMGIIAYKYFTQ